MARAAQSINDPERRKELYDRQLIRHNATAAPGTGMPGTGRRARGRRAPAWSRAAV